MTATARRRDAVDVGRALAASGRATGWRLCPDCGELGVPPGRLSRPCCIFCTRYAVAAPKPEAESSAGEDVIAVFDPADGRFTRLQNKTSQGPRVRWALAEPGRTFEVVAGPGLVYVTGSSGGLDAAAAAELESVLRRARGAAEQLARGVPAHEVECRG